MRYKKPDKKNAISIIDAAKREVEFALKLKLTQESATTIIRNIYESFRMLGDALMVSKGVSSEDHLAPIKELSKIKVQTSRPLGVIDNYRILRHNINYYGYFPNIREAEDIIDFARRCFEPIYLAVLKEIS